MWYCFATGVVGIFSYVYLSFVPGVFNLWIIGAFSVPMIAALVEMIFTNFVNKQYPIRISLFRLAIATMTMQVILKGIYDIARLDFRGEWIYMVAWMLLLITSLNVKE
jgi:hypothetical protein